jgi:cell division protein FtsL
MKKKPMIIISSFAIIIVMLAVVRVAILNSISTTGIELVTLQNEVTSYRKQNVLLKEEYLAVSSLTSIDKQAKAQGFVDTKSHIYLNTPLPLALRQ